MEGDGTLAGHQPHVVYLVMLNGRPCAWAGDRDSADRIATALRLREDKRTEAERKMGGGVQVAPQLYTVVGVTDSPYGDPNVDTSERAGTRLLATLNALETLIPRVRTWLKHGTGYTQQQLLKDLEALL